ncbi:MAG: alpha/beta hydrolase [Verrucomicrobia bacterium]|nr:alpha/beta hydrolase [Verrucomicrobiota bacterium]
MKNIRSAGLREGINVIVCFAAALLLGISPGHAQTKSPAAGKKAGKREVARTISPGTEMKEFTYKRASDTDLKVFVHYPSGWKAADKRPAIVFFFGGGWKNGSPDQFFSQADYLATRGMITARADYRVQSRQGVTPDACVEGAKSAGRWRRAHAAELGVDPDRIVAAGGSAGGHTAACTALCEGFEAKGEDLKVSSKPNALVLFNPALDLAALNVVSQWPAGKDIIPQIDPAQHITKGLVPTVLFFGTADRMIEHARQFAGRSMPLGNRVELYSAADMPHGFFNRSPWTEITARKADEFLASIGYLTGEPTLKLPEGATEALKREK